MQCSLQAIVCRGSSVQDLGIVLQDPECPLLQHSKWRRVLTIALCVCHDIIEANGVVQYQCMSCLMFLVIAANYITPGRLILLAYICRALF